MPRIRYKASRSVPYNGPSGTWFPGEEREVDEVSAKWFLGPLAEWFEECSPKAAAPVADGGSKDRAYRGGKRKG